MAKNQRNLDFGENKVVDTWGRYDIYELALAHNINAGKRTTILKDGDILHLNGSHYMIGSVVSSCLEYNECPIEGVTRAIENGHKLHFVFGLGVSITATPQSRLQAVKVDWGMEIYFQGHLFTIEKAPNNNISLKEVDRS